MSELNCHSLRRLHHLHFFCVVSTLCCVYFGDRDFFFVCNFERSFSLPFFFFSLHFNFAVVCMNETFISAHTSITTTRQSRNHDHDGNDDGDVYFCLKEKLVHIYTKYSRKRIDCVSLSFNIGFATNVFMIFFLLFSFFPSRPLSVSRYACVCCVLWSTMLGVCMNKMDWCFSIHFDCDKAEYKRKEEREKNESNLRVSFELLLFSSLL